MLEIDAYTDKAFNQWMELKHWLCWAVWIISAVNIPIRAGKLKRALNDNSMMKNCLLLIWAVINILWAKWIWWGFYLIELPEIIGWIIGWIIVLWSAVSILTRASRLMKFVEERQAE